MKQERVWYRLYTSFSTLRAVAYILGVGIIKESDYFTGNFHQVFLLILTQIKPKLKSLLEN